MPRKDPYSPLQERLLGWVMKPMSAVNTWVYRASGGRLGGRFPGGAPVLLLTTRGRRSGEPRTAPLLYLERGGDLVVVASRGGTSRHPTWYLNLEADPEAEVEIGSERRPVTARRASDVEKAELWPDLVAMYRSYDDYQGRTDRDIPVLILSPR